MAAQLLVLPLSILGAHALTYFLIGILPDAAVVALGLESVRPGVLAAFHQEHEIRPYAQVLADLMRLDLGYTLDGVAVVSELLGSLQFSLVRIFLAFLLIAGVCLMAGLHPFKQRGSSELALSFLTFLPPYVAPFMGLAVVLLVQQAFDTQSVFSEGVLVLAIAVTPGALVAVQASAIMRRNLAADYARTLLAVGATVAQQRRQLLHNVAAEIIPSMEKFYIGLVTALLFAEPVLGLSGFGTTAVRAVKRSDPDLLLGLTLTLGMTVGCCRLLALMARRHYRMML